MNSRQFDVVWTDRNLPLKVYVALRHASASEPNISVLQGEPEDAYFKTRYISNAKGVDIPDCFQADQSANIKTARYALQLLFSCEMDTADQFDLLPIAQIVQDGEEYKLDEGFIPPLLNANASPDLIHSLSTLKHNLLGRASLLESYRSVGDGGSSSYNPMAITNQLAGLVLAKYAPKVAHLIDGGLVHPFEIYGMLRELIGELSTFSRKYSIEGESRDKRLSFLPYDHNDVGRCVDVAIEIIGQLLNELTVSPELIVQMKKSDAGRFAGALPKEFFERQHSVYLLLRTGEPFDKHLSSFSSFSKLGADSQVDVYARRALPGVPVIHLQGKPIGVSSQPNTNYFMIERDGYEWGYVEDTGQIGLIWNEAPDDLVVELVLVRG